MRHSLTTILEAKLKRFHGGFLELEILEIVTRPFFYQKSLLKLEVVYSSSFKSHKVFSLKMKKESPNRCKSLKKHEIFHIARDFLNYVYLKDIHKTLKGLPKSVNV